MAENPFAQAQGPGVPHPVTWCAWEILKGGETLPDGEIAEQIAAQGLRDEIELSLIAEQLGEDPRFEQAPGGGWRLAAAAPAGEGSASPAKKRKASVELELVDGPRVSRPPKQWWAVEPAPAAAGDGAAEDEEIDICNPGPDVSPSNTPRGAAPEPAELGGPSAANGRGSSDEAPPGAAPPQEAAEAAVEGPAGQGTTLEPQPAPRQPAGDAPGPAAASPEKAPPGAKKPPLSPEKAPKPGPTGPKPFIIPKRKAAAPAAAAAPAPPAGVPAGGSPGPAPVPTAQMPRPASRTSLESPTKPGRPRDSRWAPPAGADPGAGGRRDQGPPPNLTALPVGDLRRPQSMQNLEQAGAGAGAPSRAVSPRPPALGDEARPQPWELMLRQNEGAFASAWKRLEWPRSSTSLPQHKDAAVATDAERAAWERACQRFGGGAGPPPLQQDPYPPPPSELTYVRIMQCNTATERQCMESSVFVSNHHADTDGIDPGRTLILLHNFDKKVVYGAWRAAEVGRALDPSWSAAWPFQVRVQRLAEFTPLPSALLEPVVPRRVNPRDAKPMKFFEKGTAAVREVWQLMQFYSGKGFRPKRDRL